MSHAKPSDWKVYPGPLSMLSSVKLSADSPPSGHTARHRVSLTALKKESTTIFAPITVTGWLIDGCLEIIGSSCAGLAAAFATNVAISGSVSGAASDSNFASMAGLSLTFAISVTALLNWCVRSFAQLEAAMNACERVLYYTKEIPQEAPRTSPALEQHVASSKNPQDPSDPSTFAVTANGGKADVFTQKWPETGAITLQNLKMRYRKDTPMVLKGLSVSIAGGERVGVVGR
jgi:ABC-type multidrug transport system fused ATPase/permease subunit